MDASARDAVYEQNVFDVIWGSMGEKLPFRNCVGAIVFRLRQLSIRRMCRRTIEDASLNHTSRYWTGLVAESHDDSVLGRAERQEPRRPRPMLKN